MAEQLGSDMLIKMDTATSGPPSYTTVAGLQNKSLRLSDGATDVTTQDSVGKWKKLLPGASIRMLSVSGDGVFDDSASQNAVVTTMMARALKRWQIIVPQLGTFEGLFQITSLDFKGPHTKEVGFSINLESAGEITFTAI